MFVGIAALALGFPIKVILDSERTAGAAEKSLVVFPPSSSAKPSSGDSDPLRYLGTSRFAETPRTINISAVLPENLSFNQLSSAFEAACRLHSGFDRAARLCAVMQRWATLDSNSALERLSSMQEDDSKLQCVVAVSRIIAGTMPQRISELVPAMPEGAAKNEWVRALAQSWSVTDAPAALRWANSLPAGEEKSAALNQIESNWITQNTGQVAAYIEELPGGAAKTEWIKNLAAQWAATDVDAAMEWTNRLDDSARAEAVASIAKATALNEPTRAANFVAQLPPGPEQADAAVAVASTWALRDPDGAAQWALEFSNPDIRNEALREVVSSWAAKDVAGLYNWVHLLPPSPERDTAIANVVEQTANMIPGGTSTLIGLIGDKTKQNQVALAAIQWAQRPPAPNAR